MVAHLSNAHAADKVVRGDRDEGMRVVSMYRRIMVPLDLSESSLDKAALDKALDLAEAEEGTLRLIHVVPLTPALLADYVPLDFDVQQSASIKQELDLIASDTGLKDRVTVVVRQGGVYHEILEEAKRAQIDLIVMSSHRPDMRDYLIGSNAGRVVRHATCSVLVVRH
jgi:nucleotide-binding universal stress UspA family protein